MNSKTILLAVTGLTPQVITETLYAIYQQGQPMPAEIHILTTSEGYQRAKLLLITEAWLDRFYNDYQLAKPQFTEQHIQCFDTDSGDIKSPADNQIMADTITETIRKLTADHHINLHVSIAGGRKTMSYYAGHALSLYGRPQDRLSHVLISAEYEAHPLFYYPTPYSQIIYSNDASRKALDTQNAEVTLIDIAFVRLRHGLDQALLEGKSSFSAAVNKAQQILGPAFLSMDSKNLKLIIQEQTIKLSPADFAFYQWLLNRQSKAQTAPTCPCNGSPDKAYAEQYLLHYRQLQDSDRTHQTLVDGMTKVFFEQRKSRINKQLKQALQHAAAPYLISPSGKRPQTRYRIGLEVEQIQIIHTTGNLA